MEQPKRRKRIVKQMPGELAPDEYISNDIERFRIKTFNYTLDTILNSMETRFLSNKNLYVELQCFDLRRFEDIRKNELPFSALNKICQLLPAIDEDKLKEELLSFAMSWSSISKKKKLQYAYDGLDENIIENEWIDIDDNNVNSKKCNSDKSCNSCLKCALSILTEFNMYSLQYKELYMVYKYLLTLPLTQVTCERSFSKLKLLKTRLRSTISQENLECLFLMQCEHCINVIF